jgi:hypothetical protein
MMEKDKKVQLTLEQAMKALDGGWVVNTKPWPL